MAPRYSLPPGTPTSETSILKALISASTTTFFRDGETSLAYSWFDFEIENQLPGFGSLLLPNSPAHSFSVGILYDQSR